MGPIERSEDCGEEGRCAEGDNFSSSPILGPFAGPWVSVEQWKQAYLLLTTALDLRLLFSGNVESHMGIHTACTPGDKMTFRMP
ncbi:predicted protein [Chaetomium globosum CBS 148.51]|uniref:Uncharacterized protein n=1 Tax=Chaetomium globosum (strain ATCC 6205 / CBS 148.51 / DSM 1962 / NBRC 6347 / NRRL 1970) TaxID=306901 RepID=Q2H3T6_CHAGB|nr:uncharacterized protein CHGG_06679 [Chaetomium globosum CBS 148.51]EAQ90060.1 predicted protein [Chaetomium globosum CBS 148.51]